MTDGDDETQAGARWRVPALPGSRRTAGDGRAGMTDGDDETQTRIAKLEQEISSLRRKLDRMFTVVDVATNKEPFLRLMLSLDATEAQESAVYDMMNEVDAQVSTEQSGMNHVEFGDRVSKIFPGQQATQPLAEAIVTRLAQDGEWDQVYQDLRLSGMNLSDIREARGY